MKKLRTAERRLADRNEAARCTRPWVSEVVGLDSHPPVEGIKKFTQRQIALWLNDGDHDRAVRFQERVWRPSRPVLHYAIAIDEALLQTDLPTNSARVDLDDLEAFRIIVARGEWLAPLVAADPRFHIEPTEQLRLRWHE